MMPHETDVDLVRPEAVRDPQGTFATLRADGPVHWLRRHKAWLLLDYEHVQAAIHDATFSTDTITPLYSKLSAEEREKFRPAEELFRGWMIFNDPPVHTSLRKPVASAFTPRGVSQLGREIETLTDQVLTDFANGDDRDFMSAVALRLPASVIGLLLGVPPDAYEKMREWSQRLGALVMGKVSRSDAWDRALAATEEMQVYFAELIEQYRRNPADNLISRMIKAADDEDAPLSASQLIGACSLLLFAGHETTASLISTGIYHLSRDGEARERLLNDPNVVGSAVDELLRYDGPSKIVVRRVRSDCEWNGYQFKQDEPVYCALMAANHDPEQFPEPDRFIIDRAPNRHIAFGWGRHFCLGAQLARLEAQIVIPRVLARFPRLELACDVSELSWHPTIVGRTLTALPVRID